MERPPDPHKPGHLALSDTWAVDLQTVLVDGGSHTPELALRTAQLARELRRAVREHSTDGPAQFVAGAQRWVDQLDRLAVLRTVELVSGASFAAYDPGTLVEVPRRPGRDVRPLTDLEAANVRLAATARRSDTATWHRRLSTVHLVDQGASVAECADLRCEDVERTVEPDVVKVYLPGTSGPRDDARHRLARTTELRGAAATVLVELMAENPAWPLYKGGQEVLSGRESAVAFGVKKVLVWAGLGWDSTVKAMSLSFGAARRAGAAGGLEAAAAVLGTTDYTRAADVTRHGDPDWVPTA